MSNITDFHPIIQSTFLYFSSNQSLRDIGDQQGLSKEAVRKRIQKGIEYLKKFEIKKDPPENKELRQLKAENQKQRALIATLRQELLFKTALYYLLKITLERVQSFYPHFKLRRLKPYEKKHLLDLYIKFKKAGGLVKDFCKGIGKSPETLLRWQKSYEAHGLNGLRDKTTRPKNFGNKVPSWVKQQLLMLFLKFPLWTPYQYHSHIKYSPATQWHVCLPTIKKMKTIYQEKSEAEKARIIKRWAFAPGSMMWTVDFTVILKTPEYKLQLFTVSDTQSRFLISSVLYLDTSTDLVMKQLENLFLKYGKPSIIKADNGPEFRMECRDKLKEFCVYLFNSPTYYGQFNGAHERIHRTLKTFITKFEEHKNLNQLLKEVELFQEQYNQDMPLEYLKGKTPAEVFLTEKSFVPDDTELVKPYEKEGELRLKFINRVGQPARMAMPLILKQ